MVSVAQGLHIQWPKVASYRVLAGRQILIRKEPDFGARSPQLLIQPLYGMALAAVIQQKGHLILHGSSVAIHGKGLVLIGHKGLGKSTLCATLVDLGHDFICDDITALSQTLPLANPQILPGIPRLKLWPDAAQALGHDPDKLPLVSPEIRKHILSVADRFTEEAVPLQCIVMLDHGNSLTLQAMNQAEKMLWLSGGQYFAKFQEALDPETRRRIFRDCSHLAQNTDVIRLTMPRGTKRLYEIGKILEGYMEGRETDLKESA